MSSILNLFNYVSLYTKVSINYGMIPVFAIVGLIFVLLISFNIENKNANFIFYGLNLILLGLIIYTHGMNILDNINSFWTANLFKNIYFFLTNMIVSLLVISKIYKSKRVTPTYKYMAMVIYYFIVVNLLFITYTSNYLSNIDILISDYYHFIYFGNLVGFLLYISLFFDWAVFMKKKKKHRLGNHL